MGEKGVVVDAAGEEEAVKYRGWKAMPYVIGNETFEKLGTIGTASNLLVYLTAVFHMRSVTATVLVNVWNGTTNIATIAGAFLSDSYFGRFSTLGFATVASFLGLTAIALTAAIPGLHPHKCAGGGVDGRPACPGPTPWQLAFLMAGLGLMVVGAGGIRPCNLAFGADQFDPKTESGKRGINSFFNWYYFTFTTAMMISATVIVYIQSNISWAVGLAIPAVLMFLSCFFFFVGTPIYVRVRPDGSPFTGIVQVAVAAFRKRRLGLPQGGGGGDALFNPPAAEGGLNSRLPHTDQFRFLDKAAIVTSKDEIEPGGTTATDPWRLCSLQRIEEVKCLIRVIPIWGSGTLYFMCLSQQSTYVVFQALQSDRRLGHKNPTGGFLIPAASFSVFTMLALTIWIPVYDRLLVPWARRLTGKEGGVTVLQRMGVGMALSVATLCIAAVVEARRREMPPLDPPAGVAKNGGAVSSMSSLWLIWQLVAAGVSEGFTVIGQVEFFYKQFPENMRSVAGSFFFCGMAVANYASGLMITVVHRTTGGGGGGRKSDWLAEDLNKGRLDYYYFLVAGMAAANFFYFVTVARWYRYKGCAAGAGGGAGDGHALEVAVLESKSSKISTDHDLPI